MTGIIDIKLCARDEQRSRRRMRRDQEELHRAKREELRQLRAENPQSRRLPEWKLKHRAMRRIASQNQTEETL